MFKSVDVTVSAIYHPLTDPRHDTCLLLTSSSVLRIVSLTALRRILCYLPPHRRPGRYSRRSLPSPSDVQRRHPQVWLATPCYSSPLRCARLPSLIAECPAAFYEHVCISAFPELLARIPTHPASPDAQPASVLVYTSTLLSRHTALHGAPFNAGRKRREGASLHCGCGRSRRAHSSIVVLENPAHSAHHLHATPRRVGRPRPRRVTRRHQPLRATRRLLGRRPQARHATVLHTVLRQRRVVIVMSLAGARGLYPTIDAPRVVIWLTPSIPIVTSGTVGHIARKKLWSGRVTHGLI